MSLSCELSGEGLMAEPKPAPSPQVQVCSSFLSPFPSGVKRLETIFPLLFYEVESHTDISLFKQEAFKQFTQAHLQTRGSIRELAQLSLDALPVWPTTPDCLPLPDFVITRNIAKTKQLLLNGCVSTE